MIKISIAVGGQESGYRVAVFADNIGQALSLVEARFPDGEAKVVFPIDPEPFFVRDPVGRSGLVEFEAAEQPTV